MRSQGWEGRQAIVCVEFASVARVTEMISVVVDDARVFEKEAKHVDLYNLSVSLLYHEVDFSSIEYFTISGRRGWREKDVSLRCLPFAKPSSPTPYPDSLFFALHHRAC